MAKQSNDQAINMVSTRTLKLAAKAMAFHCVRNTVIEEYHGSGNLSQEDMKAFNKEVVNNIYTWLHAGSRGTPSQRQGLANLVQWWRPPDWDEPQLNSKLLKALTKLSKMRGLTDEPES